MKVATSQLVGGVFAACAALAVGACGAEAPSESSEVPATLVVDTATDDAALLPAREPLDYSVAAAWLCRPDEPGACSQDVSAAVISADGATRIERFAANAEAPVDCFYVYPTVSTDLTPNSDATPGEDEARTAALQAGGFASVCRLYAPVYRQVTVSALREMLGGASPASDRELAYADIRAAWAHYLANDNQGRGVILVGHDQGAGLLGRLLASEIETGPQRDLLVGAILPGANVRASDFRSVAPCRTAQDVGCLIAYSSYRTEAPPGEGALFGDVEQPGGEAVCVNPAELDGSQGALKPLMPTRPLNPFLQQPGPWVAGTADPPVALVSTPGLLTARCVRIADYNYLAVTTLPDPDGARIDMIAGDVVIDGQPQPNWGLHLVDINIALGNLVAVAGQLADAYLAQSRPNATPAPQQ